MKYKATVKYTVEIEAEDDLDAEVKACEVEVSSLPGVEVSLEELEENPNCIICHKPKDNPEKDMCSKCFEEWTRNYEESKKERQRERTN